MMTDEDLYRLIGKRLRARRRMLEMTQTQVARACGTTFQQVQRQEAGERAITVARLMRLAAALRAPINLFIEPPIEAAGEEPVHQAWRGIG